MEKQTGAQSNAEADRRNENSAALQPWKEQQYRRNPEEQKPSDSFLFFSFVPVCLQTGRRVLYTR